MPDGKLADAPWHLMTYEFRMKPGEGIGAEADDGGDRGRLNRLRAAD